MPKQRSSKPQDLKQIAVEILEEAVGEPPPITPAGKKNPAAVGLGRAGALDKPAAKAKVKNFSLKKQKP